MKKSFLAFTCTAVCLLAFAATAYTQEGGSPIKVTTMLHADGTRTDTTKDIDAHTSESKTYDAANKLIQRATFTLDEDGREVDGILYDAKDKVIGQISYKYDIFGRVKEQSEMSPKGILLRRLVYQRDSKGAVTGIDIYDGQGNLIKQPTGSPKKSRSGSR